MNTPAPKPNYIFVNPNTPKDLVEVLRQLLVDKLLALQKGKAIVEC